MTGTGLSRSLRQLRAAVSRYPLLSAGLALTMVVFATGDLAEVTPFLAPLVAWPYFPLFHATHDLLGMLVALYVAYRLLPALGAGLLLLFMALQVPYIYLEFPHDLPEYFNTIGVGIVGLIGIRLIGKLQELHREVGAKATQLSFLRDLTGIMNSSLNMDEVYRAFASRLKTSVPLDRAAILWREGEQARVFSMDLDVLSPEGKIPTGGGLIPLEGTGLDWLIEHRQTHYQPDLEREGQFTTDAQHRGRGLRSYLRLPLLFQGEVIGALNLGSKLPDAYEAGERRILEALAAQIAPTVAHARLYEGQKRRAEQLSALNQVSQAVSGSLDLEAVAAQALEAALHVLDLDAGAIRYVDEATQELLMLTQRGLPREMLKERLDRPRVKIGEGLAGRVAQSGETLIVDNFSEDSRSVYQSNKTSGFQSYIGIPLKAQGRVVGTMSGLARRRRTFTPGDMEMAASMGSMVGMAIANARLFEEQKRRTQELTALHQVSQAVSQSLDMEAVAAQALEAALGFLELDAGLVRYLDEPTQELVLLTHRGLPQKFADEILAAPVPMVGQGLAGSVARSGEPLIVEDLAHATVQTYYAATRRSGFGSLLILPLKVQDRVVGLISGFCRRPRTFTPGDMEMVSSLGNMVGMAIANAGLYKEVARREEVFRSLSDSAPVGIYIVQDGSFQFINPQFQRDTGYSADELVNAHSLRLVVTEDKDMVRANAVKMLKGELSLPYEYRILHKNGETRWVLETVTPIQYRGRRAALGTFMDITEHKQAEETLKEAQKIKDEFVSTVSHELRTPLTSIRGSLGLLAGGLLNSAPEKGQHMLEIAVSNTDRLIRLINDILDFERMQSGKITMTREVCQAADLVSQTEQLLRSMAQEAGVTLSVSSEPARLWADPDRIIQVLTNLVGNAIKFSPRDTTVWLTAERQGDQMLFKVADQGPGIPADKLEVIFERFQQADASLSRAKGGAGLGLAICRSIVERHGGRIWAESTYGEGSTFFFTLPVLKEAEPAAAPEPGGPTVLVCDDDPPTLEVVGAILEGGGYRAVKVLSGQEAIEQAAALRPAAIVLDLIMPGMDGWETLAALRERPETKDIPVIILSVLQPDGRKATRSKVVDWLGKPVDEGPLFQALRRAVAQEAREPRVLVVEDDLDLARVLTAQFQRHGVETFHAETGRQAIQLAQRVLPDILVLDLILPEGDGFEVVDWLRLHDRLSQVALVVYTAKDITKADRKRLKLGETLFLTKGHVAPEEFQRQVIGLLNRMIPTKDAGVRVEA